MENLTGGTPPVRPLPCVVPCKLYFGKGVTTKASRDGHGFGLYNILRMTERYHGKILTRNESILNENYVVFGVRMP